VAGAIITPGAFPLIGAHGYGGSDGRFGAQRDGHLHEGQDLSAASGTPIVSPIAGKILFTDYQAGGAGYYVVMDAIDGRSFMFAHLLASSTTVLPGQMVVQGQSIGKVGQTGSANGPHLHFEIWINGWRTSVASQPVDPLPQLLAWDPDY
jgi:murein DD-endopeptidase MepM/ murein hydrolase activator NlpD